jgi:hypothetical protein
MRSKTIPIGKGYRILLLGIVVFAMGGMVAVLVAKHRDAASEAKDLVKVNTYRIPRGEDACAASMASCGYCPGTIIDGSCFVTRKFFLDSRNAGQLE